MRLAAYTAVLHDRDIEPALDTLVGLGLNGAEINSGGFLPARHLPIADILASDAARDDYLELFETRGLAITALNCNGNPLHPDNEVSDKHSQDMFDSIRLAERLGVTRVITMSGCPASEPGATRPTWVVNPWNSVDTETLSYQWMDVAVPFWKRVDQAASDSGVKVGIEMHPQNVVFNPTTLIRLVELTGATHVGAEMDPSHLFWQQIDPIQALEVLGELVVTAAAKDVRINEAVKIHGVLDDRFEVIPPEENPTGLGGRYVVNRWPKNPAWEFVAVGKGHTQDFWDLFVATLARTAPGTDLAIEHEDAAFGREEGLGVAAGTLLRSFKAAGIEV
jgi:sugar phosphate isomerase/epimerase